MKTSAITGSRMGFQRSNVGRRRLLADGTIGASPLAEGLSLELHTDGAGAYAARLYDLSRQWPMSISADDPSPRAMLIDDESMCFHVLEGLICLSHHARDTAQAGGSCVVRAQVYPISPDRPARLGYSRRVGAEAYTRHAVTEAPQFAEAVATLDELAGSGPALVSSAAALIHELGQAFGVSELGQISRDGRIRLPYWGAASSRAIEAWAGRNQIETTTEQLG